MGFFDRFRRQKALSASPAVLEALKDRRVNPYPILGGTNLNRRIGAAYQRGIDGSYGWIYRTQPAVRSVIDYIASNQAQLGLKLYERVDDTERVRREDHPAAQAMRNPDDWTAPDAFIRLLTTDFLIWNNAYFIKTRSKVGGKLMLLRVLPNTVTVEGGRFKPDAYWLWQADGTWYGPIPPQDVFHWKGHNPEDPLLGLSKLETLREELATDRAVQATLVELSKSSLKSGYIQRPLEAPSWSQEDAERFAEMWRAQKVRADGRDPILDEGMTYETVGISPKDAEIQSSRQFSRDVVAQEYGMEHCPPEDEDERRQFYADVLAPLCDQLAGQLCKSVLEAEFGENDFYFEFDLNEKLRGDLENRFPQLTAAAGRPWMTVNEIRAKENLPPIPGPDGDALTIPGNVALAGQQGNPNAPQLPAPNVMPPQDPNKPPQDGSYREQALSARSMGNGSTLAQDPPHESNGLKQLGVYRIEDTKALEVTTQPRREADMNRQKRNIGLTQGELGRFYRHQEQSLTAKSSKAADTEHWNERLAALLLPLLKGIMEKEGGFQAGRLGGDDFDMRQVEHYVEAMSEQTAEHLNRSTQEDIAELGLAAAFARAKGLRVETAGTTIGTRATVFARQEAAKQSPNPELRLMEWVKNTERHKALDGKKVPLGADWAGIEPGSEPNCSCTCVIA